MTSIVAASDTHGFHEHVRVPPCDVFIFAGDFTRGDQGRKDFREFLVWLERQPAPKKILISGNHDSQFEKHFDLADQMVEEYAPSVIYLQDSGCEINGIKFHGSPYTPEFFDWHFMRKRGADIKRHWDMIPGDTDILITHGPAHGILDFSSFGNEHCGCEELLKAIGRVRPLVSISGHIHGARGYKEVNGTHFFNASICDEGYRPVNKPWQFEIDEDRNFKLLSQ